MKDIKYIIKRIIIGIGIALSLMFIRGNLAYVVKAESINFTPNDIVVVTVSSNDTYSATLNTWNNESVYAFPANVPTDWQQFATIYFRYSQFGGSTYCSGTANNGSISGRIYNGSTSLNTGAIVRIEDRVNNTYTNCDSTVSGTQINFKCNNVNLSHALNLMVANANSGRYGISRALDINCTMTNEGMANSINSNNNNNTNRIINSQKEIKDAITDDNVDEAVDNGGSFFSNFSSSSHGLSGIITAPLRLLQSFTTAQCTPLSFQLPIVHNQVTLPCMRPIYENYFGVFFSLYQLITTGLISYHVCINIYKKVRDLQNPNNDRIEVLNL